MRKLCSALLAILAGLLLSAPPAEAATGASPQSCWNTVPSDWTRIGGQFWSCKRCLDAGEAGLRRGDWSDYRCRVVLVGLDVVYYLYVPPAP
jgi:hypothetical protein